MSKQLSEQMVDSILNGDKESFMQQFQAAIASKVSDAIEARKVEVASTLIAPADQIQEEIEEVDEGYATQGFGVSRGGSRRSDDELFKPDIPDRAVAAVSTGLETVATGAKRVGTAIKTGATTLAKRSFVGGLIKKATDAGARGVKAAGGAVRTAVGLEEENEE